VVLRKALVDSISVSASRNSWYGYNNIDFPDPETPGMNVIT
jgi:hypothetical protein